MTCSASGALVTMALVMPVNCVMKDGIRTPAHSSGSETVNHLAAFEQHNGDLGGAVAPGGSRWFQSR
jgi:hypothetical protein